MTTPIDISSEEYRVYTYKDGSTFRIEAPSVLHVLNDDRGETHRVVDESGLTHRPARNWIAISWKPRRNAPAFVA